MYSEITPTGLGRSYGTARNQIWVYCMQGECPTCFAIAPSLKDLLDDRTMTLISIIRDPSIGSAVSLVLTTTIWEVKTHFMSTITNEVA